MPKPSYDDLTITELGYRSRVASILRDVGLKFHGDPSQYPESYKKEDLQLIVDLLDSAKDAITTLMELEAQHGE